VWSEEVVFVDEVEVYKEIYIENNEEAYYDKVNGGEKRKWRKKKK